MATDWSTTQDFVAVEQQLWAMKLQSPESSTDAKIASEAPEQIFLTFEELDIIPQEIEGDAFYINTWVKIDQASAVGLGGWTTQYSGGTTETDNDGITR